MGCGRRKRSRLGPARLLRRSSHQQTKGRVHSELLNWSAGNLEWRFLKLPVASFGYNFRIARPELTFSRFHTARWNRTPVSPPIHRRSRAPISKGQNGRWLLVQNLVSIRRRAGTADPAEHSCKVLLRLESARYSDIKKSHFRFAQHLLGTLYPLA